MIYFKKRINENPNCQRLVKVAQYPTIYHIIFNKDQELNSNIFQILKLYLSTNTEIDYKEEKLSSELSSKIQFHENEKIINCDHNIPFKEKQQLIKEYLSAIELQYLHSEPLEILEHRIKEIKELNKTIESNILNIAKKELIQTIQKRILIAQQNTSSYKHLEKSLSTNIKKR